MASVENTMSPPCGADRAASRRGTVQHGRQRPWPLASRPEQSPLHRPFHCPLQIARPTGLDRSALACLLDPPYTDPYVRWCGRGGAARLPSIPIFGPSRRSWPLAGGSGYWGSSAATVALGPQRRGAWRSAMEGTGRFQLCRTTEIALGDDLYEGWWRSQPTRLAGMRLRSALFSSIRLINGCTDTD